MKLSKREMATVLAALRTAQSNRKQFESMPHFHIEDVKPLTNDEIDTLCEDLNCGG